MGMKNYILLLMASVLCTGCATMDPTSRTIVGSQVGMLAGTVTGAVIGHAAGGYRGAAQLYRLSGAYRDRAGRGEPARAAGRRRHARRREPA